MKKKIEQMKIA